MSDNKKDNKEVFSKVSINWYPGHMAKTKRQILEDLKLIDVVIELLDARIPISSRNPDIQELTKGKKKIILLNKCDLADEVINHKWVQKFEKETITILTDSNSGKGIDKVLKMINVVMQDEIEKQKQRGRVNKTIRVMILGVPNVGKSSFINRVAKKTSMEVGNKPGVTKKKQWVRIGKNQELLDTPGVLWPKFDSNEMALNLAFTGTIKDDLLERVDVAYELVKKMYQQDKKNILERYKITEIEKKEIEQDENSAYALMQKIGQKRGTLVTGGIVDDEKTARIILEDFRSGKLRKNKLGGTVEVEFIERKKGVEEINMLSPLVWAYIGDVIYEAFIRVSLVNESNAKPHKLHMESIHYVKAKAQADILKKIQNDLSEKELEIVKRGRNVQNHHTAKNANIADYSMSTAFEALIGYLYLTKQDERLKQILQLSFKVVNTE